MGYTGVLAWQHKGEENGAKRHLMLRMIFAISAVFVVFFGAPVFAGTATFFYSEGPWKGTVIDTETKEPIEGAVVIAAWRKIYMSPVGSNSRFLDAVETLTDKNGFFYIPKFKAVNLIPIAYMEGPRISIYKPGYSFFPSGEYFSTYFPNSLLKVSFPEMEEMLLKGVTVELLRFKTKKERMEGLPADPSLVPDEKMKHYMLLLNKERIQIGLEPVGLREGKEK